MQLGVAYSSRIMGVGALAGVPYDCLRAGNISLGHCSGEQTPDISILQANMNRWSGHEIDPVASIARERSTSTSASMISSTSPTIADQTVRLYEAFAPSGNIRYDRVSAGHTFPTDFDNPYSVGTTCSEGGSAAPASANCGFDAAGATLQWIYGPLNPRNEGPATGDLRLVDQG